MTPPKKKSGTRPVATRSGTRPATPRTGASRPAPGKPASAGNVPDTGGPAGDAGKVADGDRSNGAGRVAGAADGAASAATAGGAAKAGTAGRAGSTGESGTTSSAGKSGAGVAGGAGTGGADAAVGAGNPVSGGGAGEGAAGVRDVAKNGNGAVAGGAPGGAKAGGAKAGGAKAGAAKAGGVKAGGAKAGGAKAGGANPAPARTRPAAPTPAVVVGTIPALTRVAGAGALAVAVLLLVQPAFPLVREGGHGLGGAHNLWDFVVPLPAALLVGAAGTLCLLGRLPRLGLAALIAAGGYGVGQLFRTAALLDTGGHSSIDLPLPEGPVRAFKYTPGTGLVLQVAALAVLAAVLVLALLTWRRTIMDDDGSFDPLRPTFAGMGFAGGLIGFAAVAFPPASPLPGSLTVAMPSVFERSGLDLLGGWLLIVAVITVSVGAATVRPRLAVVGMFAGLAAMFATAALGDLLLVVRSTVLDLDTGATFQVAAAVVFAALAVAAWRVRWRPAGPRGAGA